jgi:hypothetical protein
MNDIKTAALYVLAFIVFVAVAAGLLYAYAETAHKADVENHRIEAKVLEGRLASFGRCEIVSIGEASYKTIVTLACD